VASSDQQRRDRVPGTPAGPREQRPEPQRVMGLPVELFRPRSRNEEEPQRVLGFPVETFGSVDLDWLQPLAHPVRAYKRWAERRRLGVYAPDDDDT
jgi:hypothetical protein